MSSVRCMTVSALAHRSRPAVRVSLLESEPANLGDRTAEVGAVCAVVAPVRRAANRNDATRRRSRTLGILSASSTRSGPIATAHVRIGRLARNRRMAHRVEHNRSACWQRYCRGPSRFRFLRK